MTTCLRSCTKEHSGTPHAATSPPAKNTHGLTICDHDLKWHCKEGSLQTLIVPLTKNADRVDQLDIPTHSKHVLCNLVAKYCRQNCSGCDATARGIYSRKARLLATCFAATILLNVSSFPTFCFCLLCAFRTVRTQALKR